MIAPLLLELNTRCWLRELSGSYGTAATLSQVPEAVLLDWVRMGVSHVWLMGVWTTGPRCREIAVANPSLRRAYDRVLPNWKEADVAGSPYAIQTYTVPESLGGMEGLRRVREQLNRRGLKLILDFVPNHVGLDHPWVCGNPDYFVPFDRPHADAFEARTEAGVRWIAHGRDPHFAPWTDTVQLDYRQPAVRVAMKSELNRLATLCDGVRCDMAMLVLSDVFTATWQAFPPARRDAESSPGEFWDDAVQGAREVNPEFLFLAEVYWGMEERLQASGFDFTYDKDTADALLECRGAEALRRLHQRGANFIRRSAHFLENHDEQRVAATLSLGEHRAALLTTLGLPGMRFLHDGQSEGATLHIPVQLGRRKGVAVDERVAALYREVLEALQAAGVGRGEARLLEVRSAWEGNPTNEHIAAVHWNHAPGCHSLVVANLAPHRSQGRVRMEMAGETAELWSLGDRLGAERWERSASELHRPGLFLDLSPHAAQVFSLRPLGASPQA
jgi:hypothetical protein